MGSANLPKITIPHLAANIGQKQMSFLFLNCFKYRHLREICYLAQNGPTSFNFFDKFWRKIQTVEKITNRVFEAPHQRAFGFNMPVNQPDAKLVGGNVAQELLWTKIVLAGISNLAHIRH